MMQRILPVCIVLIAWILPGCTHSDKKIMLTPFQAVYENQPPDVDSRVLEQLTLVSVNYVDEDGVPQNGQIVIHKALADDIQEVFKLIYDTQFPVASVLPIAHPIIQKKGPYGISPCTDNTSGYVWRPGVGLSRLSMHALGMAIDINPHINPYIKGKLTLPPGATYCMERPGTLTPDSPVVLLFKKRGWAWGGDWAAKGKVDYMHFEKIPQGWEGWVQEMRAGK